jgi:hypothetical protein
MGKRRVFGDEAVCDGYGMLSCECGGDLCVCGADGEDCYGCEKCADRDDDDDYFEEPTTGHSRGGVDG